MKNTLITENNFGQKNLIHVEDMEKATTKYLVEDSLRKIYPYLIKKQ